MASNSTRKDREHSDKLAALHERESDVSTREAALTEREVEIRGREAQCRAGLRRRTEGDAGPTSRSPSPNYVRLFGKRSGRSPKNARRGMTKSGARAPNQSISSSMRNARHSVRDSPRKGRRNEARLAERERALAEERRELESAKRRLDYEEQNIDDSAGRPRQSGGAADGGHSGES